MNDRVKSDPAPLGAAGFTLVEALVALVILGTCLVPIAAFISSAALRLQQAGDANARYLAQQDIMAVLEPLNPMVEPNGRMDLGRVSISWSSQPILPPNENIRIGAGLAPFSIGFYRVDVLASTAGIERWFQFSARKVGYKRIPQPEIGGAAQ